MFPWHVLAPVGRLAVGVAITWGFVYAVSWLYRHLAPAQYEYLFGKATASPVGVIAPGATVPGTTHYTELSFGHLRYTTTSLNETFLSLGSKYTRFLQIWFSVGVLFGILTMLLSGPLLLLGSIRIVQSMFLGDAAAESAKAGHAADEYDMDFAEWAGRKGQFLVTVIPGVNLPLSQIWYYLIAVFIAALVHEAGHAVAAAIERIPLHSFGFFVFLMYPGAYVNLDSHTLHLLHPFRQLRVICAGAWHNIVLFAFGFLLLNSLPVTMKWGYTTVGEVADGLVVMQVEEGSPLHGHVLPGSVVARIGDTKVYDEETWENALRQSLKNRTSIETSYCVPRSEIEGNPLDCCNISYEHPLSDTQFQCFWNRELLLKWEADHPYTAVHSELSHKGLGNRTASWFERTSMLVNAMGSVDRTDNAELVRLPAGQAACSSLHNLRSLAVTCTDGKTNCTAFGGGQCMTPFIPNPHVRLISLWVKDKLVGVNAKPAAKVRHSEHEPPLREVMFLGDPREVWEAVSVGTLFPKYAVLPVTLPAAIEMFLHHLISLSAALTFLNMIPAYRLDGAHAFSCFMDLIWPSTSPLGTNAAVEAKKRRVEKIVSSGATGLLLFAMLVGVLGAVQSGEQSLAVVDTFHGKSS
ncbi:peptidase family M50-domain-containing protein [Hyaloraphidium curvatum]|nr:peptidase family M50-domain-containing protein [Hyaloraphidium curvatum]